MFLIYFPLAGIPGCHSSGLTKVSDAIKAACPINAHTKSIGNIMKILIIGGGLLGLSSAKVLLERGHDVEVLEANNGVGLETSFANGGDLGAIGSGPWNTPIFGKKSKKIQPVAAKNKPTENTCLCLMLARRFRFSLGSFLP